jgi:Bacterial archaeo-eukaryotic release factor family 10
MWVGRFLLAPMFWALNFCRPYGVLIVERGRARIFVVRGFQIQEFNGRLPKKNITLHVRASRSESEKHREHHLEDHVRAYCKELAEKVRAFLAKEKLYEMVFGCREDLWGEAKPAFADFEKGVLIGRFVPSGYEMPTADVREATCPIFEENRARAALHGSIESGTRPPMGRWEWTPLWNV